MRKVIDFMKGHPVITGIIGVTIGVAAIGGADNYTGAGAIGDGMYLIQIACSLIAVIILWNKVGKTIDFEEIRKNW